MKHRIFCLWMTINILVSGVPEGYMEVDMDGNRVKSVKVTPNCTVELVYKPAG